MLKLNKNRKAQAVMGEYVVVIAMVVAVIVAMTIYFKRSIQSRIHDARDYMVREVRTRTAGDFAGDLYTGYEPYYGNTISQVSRDVDDRTILLPGGSSGIFIKNYDQTVTMSVNSETAPPRAFDLTTPPPTN